jgi:hypothetical protein
MPFQGLARYFFEQNTNANKKVHEAISGLKNTVSSALQQDRRDQNFSSLGK